MQPPEQNQAGEGDTPEQVQAVFRDELWWLTGFPVRPSRDAVRWMVVPDVLGRPSYEVLRLDADCLQRAHAASRWLLENAPHALASVVGDTTAWIAGIDRLLEKLKPALEQGVSPPFGAFHSGPYSFADLRAAELLRTRHPELDALIDALSWRDLRQPGRLNGSLDWVERHAQELSVLLARRPEDMPPAEQLALALSLLHLTEVDGARRIAPLVALLGDARLYEVPLQEMNSILTSIKSGLRWLDAKKMEEYDRPSTELAALLHAWAKSLPAADGQVRRQSVRLLAELCLGELLDQADRWWREAENLEKDVRRIGAHAREHRRGEAQPLRPLFEDLCARTPLRIKGAELVASLQRFTDPSARPLFRPMLRALREIPAVSVQAPVRAQVLAYWGEDAPFPPPSDENLRCRATLLREFARYLRDSQNPIEVALRPWAVFGCFGNPVLDQKLLELVRDGHIVTFFEVLSRCSRLRPEGVSQSSAVTLAEIVKLVHHADRAAELFQQIFAEVSYEAVRSKEALKMALELTADAPSEFARAAWVLEQDLHAYPGCDPNTHLQHEADVGCEFTWAGVIQDAAQQAAAIELYRHLFDPAYFWPAIQVEPGATVCAVFGDGNERNPVTVARSPRRVAEEYPCSFFGVVPYLSHEFDAQTAYSGQLVFDRADGGHMVSIMDFDAAANAICSEGRARRVIVSPGGSLRVYGDAQGYALALFLHLLRIRHCPNLIASDELGYLDRTRRWMKKAPSTDSPYSRKADPRVLMSDMVGDLCPVGVMRDGGEASPILDWMMRFDFLPAIVDKGARWGIPRDADGRRRFALELLAIVCRGASRAPAADGSVPELVVELRAALRRADTVHEPVPVVLIRAGADGNTIELLHADAGAAKCIALAGEDVRAMLRRVVDTE